MDFEKLCMVFSMKEPYYGILLSAMDKVATNITPTIGVGKAGNVFKLFYNPDFINKQTDDDVLILLKHEVCHLAFNHFTLFEDLDVDEVTHNIANIAGDMEVNGYINFPSTTKLTPCLASQIGLQNGLGGREYFRQLVQRNQQNNQRAQANNPTKPCNGGQGGQADNNQQNNSNNNGEQSGKTQDKGTSDNTGNTKSMPDSSNGSGGNDTQNGGSGKRTQQNNVGSNDQLSDELKDMNSFDDHTLWPDEDDISREQLEQMIDDLVVFAADETEKSQGTIPGELVGRIQGLRSKRAKPVADWKRYFRRYLGNEFSEIIRKSKKRESRRFPDAAGNRHRRKSHILVAIDTSGSVSMPEYEEFFGQIKTLTKDADFHVVECDACIQHEYDFKGTPNMTLHGGGGTRFEPVIDKFLEEKRKYDALVYFTDGEANIPRNTPKDTLWVISSRGDKDRAKYKVNGASVVFIPNKQTV